jgi:D-alanyl-D-alanine carboxypeptidase
MGYVILGAIVEKISGKSYEDVVQERLFSKLGMNSCGFGAAGDPLTSPPDEPWGHEFKNGVLVSVAPTLQADNPPGYNSAARVHCSLSDWGKFLQMHVDGFNGKAGLVSVMTFKKLHTVHPGGNYTYGGWQLDDRNGPALHHEGSNTMNVAQVWMAPLKNKIFMSATNAPLEIGRPAVSKAINYLIHH